jgi:hypothetical protein
VNTGWRRFFLFTPPFPAASPRTPHAQELTKDCSEGRASDIIAVEQSK